MLGRCTVIALFWLFYMERNKKLRILWSCGEYEGGGAAFFLWERVCLWASLPMGVGVLRIQTKFIPCYSSSLKCCCDLDIISLNSTSFLPICYLHRFALHFPSDKNGILII